MQSKCMYLYNTGSLLEFAYGFAILCIKSIAFIIHIDYVLSVHTSNFRALTTVSVC